MNLLKKHEFSSCVAALFYMLAFFLNALYYGFEKSVYLALIALFFVFKIIKKKPVILPKDMIFASLMGFLIVNLLSIPFYSEKGMHILYIQSILVYIFSYIFIYNLSDKQRRSAGFVLVFSALIISVFSLLMLGISSVFTMHFDVLSALGFIRDGELSGVFQYSNSFALFLILALHILLYSGCKYRYYLAFILIFTVFFTKSIAGIVFLLAYIFMYIFFYLLRGKRLYRFIFLSVVVLITLGICSYFELHKMLISNAGLFALFDFLPSSFKTRFLYYKDAIAMIKARPFGWGYYGYYFAQHYFQSGYDYNVRFVHSSVLQLLLDVGVFGATSFFLFLLSLIRRIDIRHYPVVFIVFAHSLMDFHLQFPIFILTIFLLLNYKFKRTVIKNRIFFGIILLLTISFNIFVFSFDLAYYRGDYARARRIYPHCTIAYKSDADSLDVATLKAMVEDNPYLYCVYKQLGAKQTYVKELENARLYKKYNPLGDFKEGYCIGKELDVYERFAGDEGYDDLLVPLKKEILAYHDYVSRLREDRRIVIDIRHSFDFEIDEDIRTRIENIKEDERYE